MMQKGSILVKESVSLISAASITINSKVPLTAMNGKVALGGSALASAMGVTVGFGSYFAAGTETVTDISPFFMPNLLNIGSFPLKP